MVRLLFDEGEAALIMLQVPDGVGVLLHDFFDVEATLGLHVLVHQQLGVAVVMLEGALAHLFELVHLREALQSAFYPDLRSGSQRAWDWGEDYPHAIALCPPPPAQHGTARA